MWDSQSTGWPSNDGCSKRERKQAACSAKDRPIRKQHKTTLLDKSGVHMMASSILSVLSRVESHCTSKEMFSCDLVRIQTLPLPTLSSHLAMMAGWRCSSREKATRSACAISHVASRKAITGQL